MPPRHRSTPPTRSIRPALSIAVLVGVLSTTACSGGSTAPVTVPEPPQITRLDPLEGRVGIEIRILGEGFGTDPGAVEVTFAGEPAVVSGADETSLRVVVPEVEPGKAEVVVTVEGLDSNPGTFRVRAAPPTQSPDESMSGRLAIVGEFVREHLAPDGATTCTETYDLRLDRA